MLPSNIQKVFITGGAGFIGSHLVDLLVPQGYHVTAYDNLSNGRREFIEHHIGKENFQFVKADMLDRERLEKEMGGHDLVWHLGANTDIIGGHADPQRDLNDCLIATFHVVDAMRRTGVKQILFASSGAVYGDLCREVATGEEAGPLLPVGCYAAAKLGSEAYISAYAHLYGLRAWMFRFGNVIGARMTHGVIFDFIRKLQEHPDELEILGDGTQEKNYFLVEECIEGMTFAHRNAPMSDERPCDLFNLGAESVTRVTDIAAIVKEEMGLTDARISIEGSAQAWPGDQPKVHINVEKMRRLGWTAKRSSDEAVRVAVRRMLDKDDG